mmetsp:Transcript_19764/g.49157  ORF Transcript_19764/g.49157 Transcript_19764/m.49157 type:complete len:209 (+) Transcript_19764:157-783(+)
MPGTPGPPNGSSSPSPTSPTPPSDSHPPPPTPLRPRATSSAAPGTGGEEHNLAGAASDFPDDLSPLNPSQLRRRATLGDIPDPPTPAVPLETSSNVQPNGAVEESSAIRGMPLYGVQTQIHADRDQGHSCEAQPPRIAAPTGRPVAWVAPLEARGQSTLFRIPGILPVLLAGQALLLGAPGVEPPRYGSTTKAANAWRTWRGSSSRGA